MSKRINGIIALVFRALRVVLPLERVRGCPSNRLVSTRYPGIVLFTLAVCTHPATAQQFFPPGTFSIDGFAVNCGSAFTIVTPKTYLTSPLLCQGRSCFTPGWRIFLRA